MNADATFAATPENGAIIQQMYAKECGKAMTERKMSRSEAMHRVSEEMGEAMTPPMSGKEFRAYIAQSINRIRYVNKPKVKKGGRRRSKSNWVLEEIGLVDNEGEGDMGPNERARFLLKGMSKGETRFEVCLDPEQARSIQASMTKVVPEMKWRDDQPYRSNILPNVVHQSGERRVLLVVQRL